MPKIKSKKLYKLFNYKKLKKVGKNSIEKIVQNVISHTLNNFGTMINCFAKNNWGDSPEVTHQYVLTIPYKVVQNIRGLRFIQNLAFLTYKMWRIFFASNFTNLGAYPEGVDNICRYNIWKLYHPIPTRLHLGNLGNLGKKSIFS